MAVKARAFIASVQKQSYNRDARLIQFAAVSRGEHNKEWAAATPTFNLQMTVLNKGAAAIFEQAFEEDKEIEVTFALVEKD